GEAAADQAGRLDDAALQRQAPARGMGDLEATTLVPPGPPAERTGIPSDDFESPLYEVIGYPRSQLPLLASRPVTELHLSVRASNCLTSARIETVEQLMLASRRRLLDVRNMGRKSLSELVDQLRRKLDSTAL